MQSEVFSKTTQSDSVVLSEIAKDPDVYFPLFFFFLTASSLPKESYSKTTQHIF